MSVAYLGVIGSVEPVRSVTVKNAGRQDATRPSRETIPSLCQAVCRYISAYVPSDVTFAVNSFLLDTES